MVESNKADRTDYDKILERKLRKSGTEHNNPHPIPSEVQDLRLTTTKTENRLTPEQLRDYREFRKKYLAWMYAEGKNPLAAEGYSFHTVENYAYRLSQFHRWVWDQENRYTINFTHDHAHEWVEELAYSDQKNTSKQSCIRALRVFYNWKVYRYGDELWKPLRHFPVDSYRPRDYLTKKERKLIEKAAIEYDDLPGYNDLSPIERDRWKQYISEVLKKPKTRVSHRDWEKVNGWKIPSMVATSLDAGLRPIEVENAKVSWIDTENNALRIPREDSSKNNANWIVALREDTVEYLENWLKQREYHWRYRDSDALWQTREGGRYQSQSLKYLLDRLCEIADIDTEDRQMSWYTIRHSTGTYLRQEQGLKATAVQLRHKSLKTTMKYNQTPLELRQDALERMS